MSALLPREDRRLRRRPLISVAACRTVTSALMPGRSSSPDASSSRTSTGTRCTTLMKLPDALSGGSSENRAPVPPAMLSTWPCERRGGRRCRSAPSAGCPARISASWSSLKLATTQTSSSGTSASSGRSGLTIWPASTVRRETTPRRGARTLVYETLSSASVSAAWACCARASASASAARAAPICSSAVAAAPRRPRASTMPPPEPSRAASAAASRARASASVGSAAVELASAACRAPPAAAAGRRRASARASSSSLASAWRAAAATSARAWSMAASADVHRRRWPRSGRLAPA